ncbi:MAG TPA: hypothetical protein VFZ53_17790 [Polyangiaceae bacterium]
MQSADDPERLLDDVTESADLRSALGRMSRELPDAEQMARLAGRLGIANPPPVDSGAGRLGAAKVAAGAGVVALGVLAVWLSTRGETSGVTAPGADGPAPPPGVSAAAMTESPSRRAEAPRIAHPARELDAGAPRESAPLSPATNAEPVVQAAPLAESSASPVERDVQREGDSIARDAAGSGVGPSRSSAAAGTNEPGGPAKAAPRPPPTETELLRAARLTLDGSPAQALGLSERHRSEYPNGALTQEREVIAITALVRLGRSGDARARAERFARAYPSSPYQRRIDALLPR